MVVEHCLCFWDWGCMINTASKAARSWFRVFLFKKFLETINTCVFWPILCPENASLPVAILLLLEFYLLHFHHVLLLDSCSDRSPLVAPQPCPNIWCALLPPRPSKCQRTGARRSAQQGPGGSSTAPPHPFPSKKAPSWWERRFFNCISFECQNDVPLWHVLEEYCKKQPADKEIVIIFAKMKDTWNFF